MHRVPVMCWVVPWKCWCYRHHEIGFAMHTQSHARGEKPSLLCVGEHAYYVDYRNQRPVYVDTFMEKLVNWDKVSERYAAACS